LAQFASGVDIYANTAAKHGSANRQLGKVLVLACGFGMGATKFRETAEKDYGVKLTAADALTALQAWRRDNASIVGYWKLVQDAVEASVRAPGKVITLGRIMVRTENGVTQIRKPNSVKLTYHKMRMQSGGLVFDGLNSLSKKWGIERTYGGKLVENIVQSVARDVMAEALVASARLPVMTVHDDIVWEVPTGAVMEAEGLRQVVEAPPAWASGLPIASEIKISRRYGGS
jgi:DNA polymerase